MTATWVGGGFINGTAESVYETGNHQNALQNFKNIQTNAHQILLSLLPDNTFLLDGKQRPEQIHKLITTALKL